MKEVYYLLCLFTFLGCKSVTYAPGERPCDKLLTNDFREIVYFKREMTVKGQNISFNELRFICIISALSSGKVMHEKFGNWNEEMILSTERFPFLIWKDIDLLKNGKKYTVMTNGIEAIPIYASINVFDENGNDALAANSPDILQIENFFVGLIRNQDIKNNTFYQLYRDEFGIRNP